ncbi:proline-rich protein 36-like [Tyto alba]|uniref:proline-rich protein 36-like n=1 Tax=Tyto alba TaxID=56313 RepID=UPI001C66ACC8|nr:proline-rich protein 36-like [Tyto alba]
MPPPVPAGTLLSVPGLPVSSQPAQLHPVTSQLPQASVCAQKSAEASNKDVVATEDSVPAVTPHPPALALPTSGTTTQPKAVVTTPAPPGKHTDLPEQGPAAFAEAVPEQAEDTTAWLHTEDSEDTVPDGPDSPSLAAFLRELPDLSDHVAEGSCPKEQTAVAGLGGSEDTGPDDPGLAAFLSELPDLSDLASSAFLNELPDLSMYMVDGDGPRDQAVVAQPGDSTDNRLTTDVPRLTAEVPDELPHLSEYVGGGSCPKERAVVAGLGDGEDTVPSVPNLTTSLNELPHLSEHRAEGGCKEQAATVEMVAGENTFPDVPHGLASTASVGEVPDFLEDGVQDNGPKVGLAAAMLGDADPFWGVATSPSQDPKGQQGGVAADLPTRLPPSPSEAAEEESSLETSEETSEARPAESPWKDPPQGLLESALLSPLRIPLLSPPASPPAAPQCHPPLRAPLVGEALRRQPRGGWTHLPHRDSAAVGSSKRRASDGSSVPTKRARALRDPRGQSAPHPPGRF